MAKLSLVMRPRLALFSGVAVTIIACVSFSAAEVPHHPFFAFCMDTHDSAQRTLEQQAALLKKLGFDGAGHLWLDHLKERLDTLDAAGLKLFQVYLRVDIGAQDTPYDARLDSSLPILAGRDVMLALLMTGAPPSDPAGDERGVALIREIADKARPFGVRVVLYPHANDWLERVEDCVRLARKAERPNVGVMFNLCHWLKVDEEENLERVASEAAPFLYAVSIHGADRASEIHAGTGNWIQPLDSGSFDVRRFLSVLEKHGFDGPVGLQCYGIPGDAREHLTRSMGAWRAFSRQESALSAT